MSLRLGAFHRQLVEWNERPCILTVSLPTVSSELRFAGILRPYYSLKSMRGWALVPPQQHGGFETMKLTALEFDEATMRVVLNEGKRRQLRYSVRRDVIFTLERDEAFLTGPPRTTRNGRYLYIGGRRRVVPEPWMMQ